MQQIQSRQDSPVAASGDRAGDGEGDTVARGGRAGGQGKGTLVPRPNSPRGRNADGALGSLSLTLTLTPTRQDRDLRAAE